MVDQGSLMISEVQSTDSGKYECSAQSMAGSKTGKSETSDRYNYITISIRLSLLLTNRLIY